MRIKPVVASIRRSIRSSECGVVTAGKDICRPAFGGVAGIGDELIVEGEPARGGQSVAVIRLDDLLEPGIRQLSVTDQDAETAVIQKRLVHAGNAVDDAGHPDGVVGPAPLFAVYGDAGRYGAVDVGKIPRLDVAVGPACAGEHTPILRNLLLQIEAHARPAGVHAHGVDIGGLTGRQREINGILEASRPPAVEKAGDLQLARLPPQLVPFLDFADQLELIEGRVETVARWAYPAGRCC